MIGENDQTTVYHSEDGDVLSFYQIAMRASKGTSEVEEVKEAEDGYIVDGARYVEQGDGRARHEFEW